MTAVREPKHHIWVKICGTTSLHDARLAVDLGADALGFIFAPSRRRVTPTEVAAISPLLPANVERIGVFTAGEPGEIAAAATHAGLTGVQLHASFPPAFYDRLEAAAQGRLAIIRTLHWTVPPGGGDAALSAATPEADGAIAEEAAALAESLHAVTQTALHHRVLLDARVGSALGGTGVSFPWNEAADAIRSSRDALRIIVAGGLRPENVVDAIGALSPYGVDVVSGVESEPGKKDPKKLQMFVERVRAEEKRSAH